MFGRKTRRPTLRLRQAAMHRGAVHVLDPRPRQASADGRGGRYARLLAPLGAEFLLEIARKENETGAAVESFRNESVKANQGAA